MEYLKTDIKCPDCGEYLYDIGGLHACLGCGHEQPDVNPMETLTHACNYVMMPDNDIHG